MSLCTYFTDEHDEHDDGDHHPTFCFESVLNEPHKSIFDGLVVLVD
jgi:hypothetical protein